MFDLDGLVWRKEARFDFARAMTEASLPHFPARKEAPGFSQGIAKHSGQYLLHEICFICDDDKTQTFQKLLEEGTCRESAARWFLLGDDHSTNGVHL
jgi:hypothetical protein